jgi:carbon starvation protein
MVTEGLLAALALLVVAATFTNKEALFSVVSGRGGPVAAFGMAYGNIAKVLFGGFAASFAIMVLNAFILTTLDTATRIGRYLTQELFRVKNKFLATLVVVALAGWLGLSGEWNEIWPVFGSANQLIAALTLIVASSWLLSRKKKALFTIAPMAFMLVTTMAALVLKIIEYAKARNFILLPIAIVLVILAVFIFIEAITTIRKKEIGAKQ